MFETYTAAQYRALDDEKFAARKQEVKDLLSAETLPEGVTDEALFAEADLIDADEKRRSRAASIRTNDLAAVKAGAGTVVASSEPEQKRSSIKQVSNYTDSPEYRKALVAHITRQAPMPADMIARAQAEYRDAAPIDVTVTNAYSNYTDPLGVPMLGAVPLPLTFMQEVAREMKVYGGLDTKVSRTSIQGGVAVSEAELVGEAMWINDKQVSPWNEDSFQTFTFSAWQLEYRVARSLLAQAMLTDNFTNNAAQIAAEFSRQLNAAIWNGNGTGKPTGILADPRLLGAGTEGQDGYIKPHATVVEVTKEDMDNWAFWASIQYKLNAAYRGRGEWIMSDADWAKHVSVLRDDNHRPIASFIGRHDTINDTFVPAINNRPVNLIDDAIAGKDFDAMEVGQVFAVFGDLKHYTLNTQPGMPLTTLSWDDHDNNLHKTKVSMACDGRVTNPFGWLLLKKKASA